MYIAMSAVGEEKMRVRSSVEAIRNLERSLALDEAAVRPGMWNDAAEAQVKEHQATYTPESTDVSGDPEVLPYTLTDALQYRDTPL